MHSMHAEMPCCKVQVGKARRQKRTPTRGKDTAALLSAAAEQFGEQADQKEPSPDDNERYAGLQKPVVRTVRIIGGPGFDRTVSCWCGLRAASAKRPAKQAGLILHAESAPMFCHDDLNSYSEAVRGVNCRN